MMPFPITAKVRNCACIYRLPRFWRSLAQSGSDLGPWTEPLSARGRALQLVSGNLRYRDLTFSAPRANWQIISRTSFSERSPIAQCRNAQTLQRK
jgi:hypothetical protein